jgi:hypothetical protein
MQAKDSKIKVNKNYIIIQVLINNFILNKIYKWSCSCIFGTDFLLYNAS